LDRRPRRATLAAGMMNHLQTAHPMQSSEPLISVVISFKNEGPTLPLILDSLNQQKTDFPFEVIFADGCSTDNSVAVIKNHPLSQKVPVSIVSLPPENHGMTVGWNTGAKQARGKILLISQADMRIKDFHALTKIARCFEDPAVVGTFYNAFESDAEFKSYDFWGQVFISHHLGARARRVYDEKFNGVRRDVFEKMNGFDDKRFPLGGESMDFLGRLRAFGNIVETDIEAEHLHAFGKRHSAKGLLRKLARNAEVMGANVTVHYHHRDLDPGFFSNLFQRLFVSLNSIASLVPLTWPWTLLISLAIGCYWNKSSFKHVRNWRLIYIPIFGFAGVYVFTFYFLRGLILRRTMFQFDNTMR
jgi:glycosyltransferase involved in cell wall biosynthesis